jgi:hypothetical protein
MGDDGESAPYGKKGRVGTRKLLHLRISPKVPIWKRWRKKLANTNQRRNSQHG